MCCVDVVVDLFNHLLLLPFFDCQELKKQAVAVRAVLGKVNQSGLSDPKVVTVYCDRMDFLKLVPVCPNPFPAFLVQMFYRTRVSNVKSNEEFWSLVTTSKFQYV